jgi:hypothetical protein
VQKKKQITHFGIAPLFHKAALQFALRWLRENNNKLRVHKSRIEWIERMATCNWRWPRHLANQDFASSYWENPNLAADLLSYLRKKWSTLDSSRPGKLKKFMAFNVTVPWDNSFNTRAAVKEAEEYERRCQARRPPDDAPIEMFNEWIKNNWIEWDKRKYSGPTPSTIGDVPIWKLEDAQIANAFAKSADGFLASKTQIREARRQVIADHLASKEFAAKVLDEDGFLIVGKVA